MKPYSNHLRQKVIRAYNRGEGTLRTLAAQFSVSIDFVSGFDQPARWIPNPMEAGNRQRSREKRWSIYADWLRPIRGYRIFCVKTAVKGCFINQ